MNPTPGQHGAFVSNDEMLRTIQSLTIAVAENNVQLNSMINEMKDVKAIQDDHRKDLDSVKAKLYSMSAIIGIGVTLFTNWVTGKI